MKGPAVSDKTISTRPWRRNTGIYSAKLQRVYIYIYIYIVSLSPEISRPGYRSTEKVKQLHSELSVWLSRLSFAVIDAILLRRFPTTDRERSVLSPRESGKNLSVKIRNFVDELGNIYRESILNNGFLRIQIKQYLKTGTWNFRVNEIIYFANLKLKCEKKYSVSIIWNNVKWNIFFFWFLTT